MKRAPDPLPASWTLNADGADVPVLFSGWPAPEDVVVIGANVAAAVTSGYVRLVGDDPGLENNLDMRAVPVQVRKYHNPGMHWSGYLRSMVMRIMAYLKSHGLIPPNTPPPWANP